MRARTQLKKWKQQSRAIQEKIGTESLKSPEALKQRIEKTFAELDSSGDGFIDFNELKVVHPPPFSRYPTPLIRVVSLREWKRWGW